MMLNVIAAAKVDTVSIAFMTLSYDLCATGSSDLSFEVVLQALGEPRTIAPDILSFWGEAASAILTTLSRGT
jgi:hypothetical protein